MQQRASSSKKSLARWPGARWLCNAGSRETCLPFRGAAVGTALAVEGTERVPQAAASGLSVDDHLRRIIYYR